MTTTEVGDKSRRPVNIARFFGEVRQEARKVTWTTRKETVITTVMVFIMVAVAAVFFFVADLVLGAAVRALLSLSL
jgi:preprotein translocase subunit SecE